jgi:hypothetical protein
MSEYVGQINTLYGNITSRLNVLAAKQKEIDIKEQEILHYIEFKKYDAVAGSKLIKLLRTTRQERRVIKDEMEELGSIKKRMENARLNNYKSPSHKYTYNSTVIDKLLNKKGC